VKLTNAISATEADVGKIHLPVAGRNDGGREGEGIVVTHATAGTTTPTISTTSPTSLGSVVQAISTRIKKDVLIGFLHGNGRRTGRERYRRRRAVRQRSGILTPGVGIDVGCGVGIFVIVAVIVGAVLLSSATAAGTGDA